MPKTPPPYLSEARMHAKAAQFLRDCLEDPAFQAALKKIRAQFDIPSPATPEVVPSVIDGQVHLALPGHPHAEG